MDRSLARAREDGIVSASSKEAKGLSSKAQDQKSYCNLSLIRFSKTAERVDLDDEAVKEVILPRVMTSTTLPRLTKDNN